MPAAVLLLLLIPFTTSGETPAAVEELLAPYASPSRPGCAIGVVKNRQIVLQQAVGSAGGGRPLTPQTPLYIASLSKQFTAAAVYRLASLQKIRLGDTIGVALTGLSRPTADPTIRQLLNHTSGLRDYHALLEVAGRLNEPVDNAGVLGILNAQRSLNFTPGTNYEYSNSDYVLLGLLVERAAGASLGSFVEREFLIPFGMRDSWFGEGHRLREDTARGYAVRDGVLRPSEPPTSTGDGGMYSTVSDLLRWLLELTRHPAAADPLKQIQIPARLASGERLPHASGLFWGRHNGRQTLSHNGSVQGFQADLVHFPKERLSVVCLCNRDDVDASSLSRKIADVYLGKRSPKPVVGANRPVPPALTGIWESKRGFVLSTKVEGGVLVASLGGETFSLTPRPKSRLLSTEADAFPMILRPGGSDALDFGIEGDRQERFRRVPPDRAPLPLSAFAGHFVNREMNLAWDLVVEEGSLILRTPAGWRIPFSPAASGRFEAGPWLLQFDRDRSGITRLRLHRLRLWNLSFQKVDSP